ncbi:MAG: hypothetical protein ACPG6R_10890 [Aequoribacter sp.]|uniref:hypothetical protein n=1 Tax=Aequoribacter sp. TaxID=2847771 RepID=UPI003C32B299
MRIKKLGLNNVEDLGPGTVFSRFDAPYMRTGRSQSWMPSDKVFAVNLESGTLVAFSRGTGVRVVVGAVLHIEGDDNSDVTGENKIALARQHIAAMLREFNVGTDAEIATMADLDDIERGDLERLIIRLRDYALLAATSVES